MDNEIKIFEGNKIRSIWDKEKEEWYFSIIFVLFNQYHLQKPNHLRCD